MYIYILRETNISTIKNDKIFKTKPSLKIFN